MIKTTPVQEFLRYVWALIHIHTMNGHQIFEFTSAPLERTGRLYPSTRPCYTIMWGHVQYFEFYIDGALDVMYVDLLYRQYDFNWSWSFLKLDIEPDTELYAWLPDKLPPNVRCVMSMINNSPAHQQLKGRGTEKLLEELKEKEVNSFVNSTKWNTTHVLNLKMNNK